MKKLIVANWKMNPASKKEALELFEAVKNNAKKMEAQVVICPPFVYVSELKGLAIGSQNVSFEPKGAFTGQVSAAQLKDLGVEYVIVGHSETRKNLHETDEEIAKKVQAVLEAGMVPILCVGENEGEDRDEVLKRQVPQGLPSNVVIAYEPIWAIGTGKNCQPQQVIEARDLIKKIAGDVAVLYGGSVNAANAKQYLEVVNGLLVGGASLKTDEFTGIMEAAG